MNLHDFRRLPIRIDGKPATERALYGVPKEADGAGTGRLPRLVRVRLRGWTHVKKRRRAEVQHTIESMTSHAVNVRTGRRVAIAGVGASAILACMNIGVGLLAHSTSVLATGLEFAGDVIASTVVLGGMLIAARPADENHPYGHGRVEMLAGFVVGMIVMLGGVGICYQSLQAIGDVHPPPGRVAIAALIVAILIRAGMSAIKFRVGRRIQSGSLIADAWNDAVDILSASAALTAVVLTVSDPVRFMAADHYGGFVVGVIVVLIGIRIGHDASFELVDTMPEPAMANQIRDVAASVPGVLVVDKSRARKTGLQYHVDLHVQVDRAMTVEEAHDVGGHVRAEVRRRLPWVADVLVHIEPANAPSLLPARPPRREVIADRE